MARRFPWQERSQKVSDLLHFHFWDKKKSRLLSKLRKKAHCWEHTVEPDTHLCRITELLSALSLCYSAALLLCHSATLLVTPDVTFTSQLGTTDRFPPATFSNFSALDKTQNPPFRNQNMDSSSYISNIIDYLTFLQTLCACTLRPIPTMLFLDIMVVALPCH